MATDSVKSKNYISASYADLTLPYLTGELNMGFLNYSRAHTTKSMNIAYGVFGFFGKTNYIDDNNSTTTHDFSGKHFVGGGVRTSIGFYDYVDAMEFRIISWENALSFENGSYSDFRKKMNALGDPEIHSSPLSTIYTTGGSSEIIFHAKRNKNNQFAFRLFYGFTPRLSKSLSSLSEKSHGGAIDFSFFAKFNKLYGTMSFGGSKGASSKISLGYSF